MPELRSRKNSKDSTAQPSGDKPGKKRKGSKDSTPSSDDVPGPSKPRKNSKDTTPPHSCDDAPGPSRRMGQRKNSKDQEFIPLLLPCEPGPSRAEEEREAPQNDALDPPDRDASPIRRGVSWRADVVEPPVRARLVPRPRLPALEADEEAFACSWTSFREWCSPGKIFLFLSLIVFIAFVSWLLDRYYADEVAIEQLSPEELAFINPMNRFRDERRMFGREWDNPHSGSAHFDSAHSATSPARVYAAFFLVLGVTFLSLSRACRFLF